MGRTILNWVGLYSRVGLNMSRYGSYFAVIYFYSFGHLQANSAQDCQKLLENYANKRLQMVIDNKHCEKNITLLRIKSNAIWGFGTQNAISLQSLASIIAEFK